MTRPLLPGHPHFAYREGELFVEDISLRELAAAHATPLFV
jgi:diaminopimelate decarboxylase